MSNAELLRGLSHQDIVSSGFHRIEPDYRVIENISSSLQQDVFGQERACDQLARAITRSHSGFSDPRRPEGIFMFLGPTGVGKTEMAKALTRYLYPKDSDKRLLRIDCTQLQESHSVGRLKGSEPSYVGYGDNNILITPEFLQRGGVILLDEVEKADQAIWKWLLPVFEEGQQKALVPKEGERGAELTTLDFSNTYIVLTSNVGAEALHNARLGKTIGFHTNVEKPDMEKIGLAELKKSFAQMPEFLGRLDSTVVFNELQPQDYDRIFMKFMREINEDQRYGQNFLAATSELRAFILGKAVGAGEYGAREIRHAINQWLVDKASEIKFSGVLKDGQVLIGDVEDDNVIFWTSDLIEKEPEPEPEPITRDDLTPDEIDELNNIDENKPPKLLQEPPHIPVEDKPRKKFHPKNPPKGVTFYISPQPPSHTIDLAITVHTPEGDQQQILENLPLLPKGE